MTHEELKTLLSKADEAVSANNYDEAEQLAQHVLSEASPEKTEGGSISSKNVELYCSALLTLADSAQSKDDYERALSHARLALDVVEGYNFLEVKGRAWNSCGRVYQFLGNYDKALEFYAKSLAAYEELGDKRLKGSTMVHIGIVYARVGNFPSALEYFTKALVIFDEIGDKSFRANVSGNIGNVYWGMGNYFLALEYHGKALTESQELGNKAGVASATANSGTVYHDMGEYSLALEYYAKALAVREELGNKVSAARIIGNIGNVFSSLGDYPRALEYFTRALAAHEELGNEKSAITVTGSIGSAYYALGNHACALEYMGKALAAAQKLGDKIESARGFGNIGGVYYTLGDNSMALEYFGKALAAHEELGDKSGVAGDIGNIGDLYANKNFEGYDPVKAEEMFLKVLAMDEEIGAKHHLYHMHQSLAKLYEQQERWKEANEHNKKYHSIFQEVQSEEATKQAQLMEHRRKVEEAERDRQIKLARFQEQEKILHNMLPMHIADRIIAGEKTIADSHHSVSVFFSDIVGFTKLSQHISPEALVTLLNGMFTEFDRIAQKHGLEKIKTIGDAYMAVAGAPTANDRHALSAAQFAFDVVECMKSLAPVNGVQLQIRIGLHSGSVVAGIIGESKFAYDLWGDAVNTASRMESHGEAGRVHVSEEFVVALEATQISALSRSLSESYNLIPRGEIDIKGKGVMRTFFLEKT